MGFRRWLITSGGYYGTNIMTGNNQPVKLSNNEATTMSWLNTVKTVMDTGGITEQAAHRGREKN